MRYRRSREVGSEGKKERQGGWEARRVGRSEREGLGGEGGEEDSRLSRMGGGGER